MDHGVQAIVSGGACYIGSHTTLALLQAGFEVVVSDNLCKASAESLGRLEQLDGRAPMFVKGNIRDRASLDNLLAQQHVKSALHFAGLKSV